MKRRHQMKNEKLEEIRKRFEKATIGPWYWYFGEQKYEYESLAVKSYDAIDILSADNDLIIASGENADFIAHAWEDVSRLLSEIDSLREKKET